MTDSGSFFSCINPQAGREESARPAPPPPLPPQPAVAPAAERQDALREKIAALEERLGRLEQRESAAAMSVESLKAEAQAARRRCAELEAGSAGVKTAAEVCSANFGRLSADLAALAERAGSMEERLRRLDPASISSVAAGIGSFEGRLKSLEGGLARELRERFAKMEEALGEISGRAGLLQEISAASGRRIEKLEESSARLQYLEERLAGGEGKFERIYELESLCRSLSLSVKELQKTSDGVSRGSALLSAEHKKNSSDMESLSRQVRQLTALFNQLRTELAFLMPQTRESAAE